MISAVVCAAVIGIVIYLGILSNPTAQRQVTLRVESGGGYAIITYQAGNEKTDKNLTINTPWERTFSVRRGEQVYLTASNPNQIGTVTCSLRLDYLIAWKNNKTNAPKDGVACGGIVP